jgi:septal ring factor EnvC (AmiA/AmiB activator)
MAVVLGIFLAITSDPAREAIEQLVNYHKGKVDEQVANNDQQGEALARKVKELEAKAEAVRNEIKENEQATKETMDDIDRAVNAGDLRELERIRRRLNNR